MKTTINNWYLIEIVKDNSDIPSNPLGFILWGDVVSAETEHFFRVIMFAQV